ncbi:MAG: aminotransferase class I/II-fold pyridoxal phosphate-dependent enzyme [Patescibacteria group bacterium]
MPKSFMPIAAAFAPNYTLGDVLIACRYFFWGDGKSLQDGKNIGKLERAFEKYMGAEKAVSFDQARSGFCAILQAMEIGEEDEVILQAFTTVALSNTIRLLGAKPVYVDIEERTFNMNPDKLEEKITGKTKAIIIQHTFGNPASVAEILSIAKKYNLKTIEDCAHSLGAEYRGEKTGKFADAAFFSFGRDKVISAVAGGMVIAKDAGLMKKVEDIRDGLPFPSVKAVRKSLLHPIITFKALHTYNLFSWGKAMMFLAFKLKLLDKAYTAEEKKGEPQKDFAKKMPNALAAIALHQLGKVDEFNSHRIKIAKIYGKNISVKGVGLPETLPNCKNIFLWYTITAADKKNIIAAAAKKNIILGDWFPQAVGPIEVDLNKSGYQKGSCPVAEKVSAHCVNLPTHHNIHEEEAKKVADFINGFEG